MKILHERSLTMRGISVLVFLFALTTGVRAASPACPVVGDDVTRVVEAEDNLYTLAIEYGLAVEHLAFANGIFPIQLYVEPGTVLRIPLRRILPVHPPRDGI